MYLIIRLLEKYALWVYIACGIGMILYLRAALIARREGIYAIYSLERAQAAKRIYRASWMILFLLFLAIGVYVLTNYVEIAPPVVAEETPTPEVTPTVTPTKRPQFTPTPTTPTPVATPTRRLRETVVAQPTVPAQSTPPAPTARVQPANCPHPNVQIVQPAANQTINAGIQVIGTATKDNFDRYEFKFKNLDIQDEWHWVETFTTPVENGNLGYWNTTHLPAGLYSLMVIAIDKTGNSQECIVSVVIKH